MAKSTLAFFLFLFASSLTASAANANELKGWCTDSPAGGNPLRCLGYIEGVFDNEVGSVFTVTGDQGQYPLRLFRDAFLDYMREHPEKGDISAAWLLPITWESRKLIAFIPPKQAK